MRVLLLDGNRHANPESGYGQLAAGIKDVLEERRVEVILDPSQQADVALYVCPPYSMLDRDFDFPVAIFTMHELEDLPESKADWPARLNTTDLVLTPTTWNRAVWKKVGVTARIEVVPLGVNTTHYYPRWGRRCRFLTVHSGLGSRSSRESWWDTLQAYNSAFRIDDDVELVIKTWSWHPGQFERARAEANRADGRDPATSPAVTIIQERLDRSAMRDLYLSSWLFIKNANREGWSLPCTEAVACGVRIAATEIQPLVSHLPNGTRWFTLGNADELAFLMRLERREHAAKLAMAHRYSTENTGAWVHRYLKELIDRAAVTRA